MTEKRLSRLDVYALVGIGAYTAITCAALLAAPNDAGELMIGLGVIAAIILAARWACRRAWTAIKGQ